LEVSPAEVWIEASVRDSDLVIAVTDRGPGFPEAMLDAFGRPYSSTKGRPGGGLGLFLVVNVLRKLGGRVTVANRPHGGALVQLT
ncbi:ATP-binding protein, partial [Acinetobacter baumannii]